MPRRTRRPVTLVLALVGVAAGVALAACQDYNFSPVKYCLIQPGTERVTLSSISTADILFVVDDSGSMGGEQQKLKDSFAAFVTDLRGTNQDRAGAGLEPIDFHIAITTTSVFMNTRTNAVCSDSCGGVPAGSKVCCASAQPLREPRDCAAETPGPASDCTGNNQCRTDCLGRSGELTCCAGASGIPEQVPVTCGQVGADCGQILDRYLVSRSPKACAGSGDTSSCDASGGFACRNTCTDLQGQWYCCTAAGITQRVNTCDVGVGAEGALYPAGDFVRARKAAPAPPNARVLHFEKDLFCSVPAGGGACNCTYQGAPATCAPEATNAATLGALVDQFKENIVVGTCGSGQEQGLEAAKLAIKKALGQDGLAQPPDVDGQPPEWPHPRRVVVAPEEPSSKLVVVFVGDEDDCSSPRDVTGGIIFNGPVPPASTAKDACEHDALQAAELQRAYKLQEYADFLTGLGRPVAGAFIVSARGSPCGDAVSCRALCGADTCPENCVDAGCAAAVCCDYQGTGSTLVCGDQETFGGQGAGYRLLDLASLLRGKKADVVAGSVCSPGENPAVVPPPPTPPSGFASPGFSSILQRVAEVVKQPIGLELPTQPASAELSVLRIVGADGATRKTCSRPALPPLTIAEAEAQRFDWWFTAGDDTDRTPTGPSRFIFLNKATENCIANPGETYSADYLGLVPASGCQNVAECQAALGGAMEDWSCCAGVDATGACLAPSGPTRGSCLCGSF